MSKNTTLKTNLSSALFATAMIIFLVNIGFARSNDKTNISEANPSNTCSNPTANALGYNAFVRNEAHLGSGDTDGPVAIGGDLTLDGIITVAGQTAGTNYFNGDSEASSLVVNGKIIYDHGQGIQLNQGFAKVGDLQGSFVYDLDNNRVTTNTRVTPGTYDMIPRVQVHNKQPANSVNHNNLIDFEAAFTGFLARSKQFSEFDANLEIDAHNKIRLTENQVNVINITGNELLSLPYLTFENAPNIDTPLIINVDVSVDFEWNIFNIAGIGDQQGRFILWNFYNAPSITLKGGGTLVGTLFAPQSSVTKNSSGNVNGQVIALNYYHNGGELHHHVFEPCIDNPTDNCSVVVNDQEICLGDSTTLVAVGEGTVVWSTGETTPSITVDPTETTTYSVTITKDGCSATDEAVVTVKSPEVNIGENIIICLGDEVTLTSTEADTYLWSTGETTQSITVSPTESIAWYKIEVTIDGCVATDMVDVFVTSPEVTVEDQEICLGDSATLTAVGEGSVLWSTGETTPSITVSPTETTTYSVTITKGGCTAIDEAVVTVKSPEVSIGENIIICLGDEVTLTSTKADTYLWSTGETTQSITVSPTESIAWYKIEVTIDGCVATDMVDVFVTSPEVTVEDQEVCLGGSATLTAVGEGSVLWSTGETTASITVSPIETTTYSVTITKGGCTATDEAIVTVKSATVSLGDDISVCEGEEVVLVATEADEYSWSTGETTQSIIVNPKETSEYTVVVKQGDCEAADTILVNVNSVTADAGSDITITKGETTTLTASGGDTYLWSTGETTMSIEVTPEVTTEYAVTVQKNGCEDMDTVVVTVDVDMNCSIVANAGDDVTVCIGEFVELTANGGDSYVWSAPTIDGVIRDQTIRVSTRRNVEYTVKVFKDGCDNFDTDSVMILVETCDGGGDGTNRIAAVYPTLVNSRTKMSLDLKLEKKQKVTISLHDLTGGNKSTVINRFVDQGDETVDINFSTLPQLSEGIYMMRIVGDGWSKVEKIVVDNKKN
ncbi:choice-of-anchor A family protein [Aquimarina sp. AD10]|uniref:collagen-binding domain-containing protein n=1 Tax=Aquimarina sp. AD10 TaxID=1714849 RepID=UPI000E518DEC|nr:collagen-binding domain-containing protein [Aquimarina sp. AD10]AXT62754.1 choice-of-anchor A family protein [Aquimarina sp. AD10]RKN01938.1 choice-of-anchor A family protein [Aquimarina sp. AD10]